MTYYRVNDIVTLNAECTAEQYNNFAMCYAMSTKDYEFNIEAVWKHFELEPRVAMRCENITLRNVNKNNFNSENVYRN